MFKFLKRVSLLCKHHMIGISRVGHLSSVCKYCINRSSMIDRKLCFSTIKLGLHLYIVIYSINYSNVFHVFQILDHKSLLNQLKRGQSFAY